MLRVQAISSDDLVDLATWPLDRLRSYWDATQKNYVEAVDASNKIMTNSNVINYIPEAKAEILHLLSSNTSQALKLKNKDFEQLASAAFVVLNTAQSHREFIEILRRMGQGDNTKGNVADLKNNYVNLVLRFLYRSSKAKATEQWLSGLYS